jgi:DNA-binding MarR family transcriptional regulator
LYVEDLKRGSNPANRRELLVTLTDPGVRKWKETADMWRHVNAAAYAGFSAKEIDRLADLLTRASANLDAAAGVPPAPRP